MNKFINEAITKIPKHKNIADVSKQIAIFPDVEGIASTGGAKRTCRLLLRVSNSFAPAYMQMIEANPETYVQDFS